MFEYTIQYMYDGEWVEMAQTDFIEAARDTIREIRNEGCVGRILNSMGEVVE